MIGWTGTKEEAEQFIVRADNHRFFKDIVERQQEARAAREAE